MLCQAQVPHGSSSLPSVCLSVCLSHTAEGRTVNQASLGPSEAVSKRGDLGRRSALSLHHQHWVQQTPKAGSRAPWSPVNWPHLGSPPQPLPCVAGARLHAVWEPPSLACRVGPPALWLPVAPRGGHGPPAALGHPPPSRAHGTWSSGPSASQAGLCWPPEGAQEDSVPAPGTALLHLTRRNPSPLSFPRFSMALPLRNISRIQLPRPTLVQRSCTHCLGCCRRLPARLPPSPCRCH